MATTSIVSQAADMMRSGRESEDRRLDHVCVLVLVDTTVATQLALTVRDDFDPRMHTGEVRVYPTNEVRDFAYPNLPDVAVVLCGRDTMGVRDGVSAMAWAGVPVAVVAESALDVPSFPLGETAAKRVSLISAATPEVLNDRLAEWLIGATDKSIALAANFPFCRKAKVRELVRDYALENAKVTAKMGKGAEMPSLALNQARLALNIAAVNGQPLALKRIPEVLSAVGAGMGSRFMANRAIGQFPLLGMAFKAGFGFLGTEATGMALQRRFEKQEREPSSTSSIERSRSLAQKAAEALRSRLPIREGKPVKSSGATTVRLLEAANEDEPSYLVYDEGDRP